MSLNSFQSKAKESYDYSVALEALGQTFGDRLLTGDSACEQAGKDESFHPSLPPHAVIRVRNREEVQGVVRICSHSGTPIVPRGAGTSLEGSVGALKGGISIDFSEMNRILEVHPEDFDVVVEPGVTRQQLNQYLRDQGLFFPIDPGANATIGGMTATRASGTNAVRYGTMRDNVINVEAVLADGSLIRTGRRARKSAAGYDLTRLLVGSEGTLGVFTEITLRVYPIPEAISAAVCTFASMEGAVDSVIGIIQYGIPIARVELLDALTMQSINMYSGGDFSESPTLFLEFHGSDSSVREQAELSQSIVQENGGGGFQWTANTEERSRLWRARHEVAWAGKLLHPKGEIWSTDVCVPISRLADCISQTRADIDESGLLAPIVGHVGDGNFHLLLLVDHDDPEEVERAHALHRRMVLRALDMDGTCTGEHGIGYGKIGFLELEHGDALEPMRMIKRSLDPQNIFNPGKVLRGL
jgi:D-lactate dehydrogenase (cytochrome)